MGPSPKILSENVLSRAPLAEIGPVLEFVPPGAMGAALGDELPIASWLVGDRDLVEGPLSRVSPRDEDAIQTLVRLAETRRLDSGNLARILRSGDICQIAADLRIILSRDGSLTETSTFMHDHAQFGGDSSILEVGSSCGRHLRGLIPANPELLVGVDLNLFALVAGALAWRAVDGCEVAHFIHANALDLPFSNATFTHLHCFGTLVLLPVARALREFRRVLRPGGRFILTLEGVGLWQRFWDEAWSTRRRFNLLRGALGNALMARGFDWQRYTLLRRLSIHTQFQPSSIPRMLERHGFLVDRCEVLRTYAGQPWIIGVAARSRLDVP
jgi:SAM-dependent methyltransferase